MDTSVGGENGNAEVEVCCKCHYSRYQPVFGDQWLPASPVDGIPVQKVVCPICALGLPLAERMNLPPDITPLS